jgi:serine/threonine protein phosphatase PrpC
MESLTTFTTCGLVKSVNEDIVAIRHLRKNQAVVCICDGHWGKKAAQFANRTFIADFPSSRPQAVRILSHIQLQLFRQNHTSRRPSETSVLAVKVDPKRNSLLYVSYGDCRLLHVRTSQVLFQLPTFPTWLGPLSHTGARNRIPVQQAAVFGSLQFFSGDRIMLFTDGIDECVYETPTLSASWLAGRSASEIISEVTAHGAQDNASLVIIEC